MNIRDLQYFVAVADLSHFGKAAERCNVSQPTLSMQLKKLSEVLGVSLFDHSSKTVILTPVAKEILTHARMILEQAQQIKEIASASKKDFVGDLTVGLPGTLGPYLLPYFFDELRKLYPMTKISYVEERAVKLLRRVNNGRLDCALLASSYDSDAMAGAKLFDEAYYLAVSRTHPLASRQAVSMADLKKLSLLLLDENHCWSENSSDVCHFLSGVEVNSFRATSIETLRQMVAKGDHVTLIPKCAINLQDAQVVYIPFKSPSPSRSVSLVWRKNSSQQAFFIQLHARLSAILGELLSE